MSDNNRFLTKFVAPLAESAINKLVRDFKNNNLKLYLDGNSFRIVNKNKKNSFDYTLSLEEAKKFFMNLFSPDD